MILQLISLCLRHINTENANKAFWFRSLCLAGLHIYLLIFYKCQKLRHLARHSNSVSYTHLTLPTNREV